MHAATLLGTAGFGSYTVAETRQRWLCGKRPSSIVCAKSFCLCQKLSIRNETILLLLLLSKKKKSCFSFCFSLFRQLPQIVCLKQDPLVVIFRQNMHSLHPSCSIMVMAIIAIIFREINGRHSSFPCQHPENVPSPARVTARGELYSQQAVTMNIECPFMRRAEMWSFTVLECALHCICPSHST